jgi:protein TonB
MGTRFPGTDGETMIAVLTVFTVVAGLSPIDSPRGPLRPGQVVEVAVPEALTRVRPMVPAGAQSLPIDETVVVLANVGEDGRVTETTIARSVPALDAAARAAVGQWVFEPPRDENGRPQSIWRTVSLHFSKDRWTGAGWVDRAPAPRKPPAVIEYESDGSQARDSKGSTTTVVVHVFVDEDGRVVKTRVVDSIPALDHLAESAASGTRFEPATNHGQPVAAWAALTLRFHVR